MLTGPQIREARKLLRWSRIRFMESTSFTHAFAVAIESSDGPAWLSDDQEASIRRAMEGAGIEFIPENGEGAGVRLRKAEL